ncbi:hypothetical protein FQN57_004661 [Myotisia sp. PD_48]|nr:hypothetical protein FQN57_004661 [Myotisia sp. PD_48]
MSNIIVTGAGSGCGRGFVEAYSRNPSNTIFAIDRTFRSSTVTSTPAFCRDSECFNQAHSLSDKCFPGYIPAEYLQKNQNTERKQGVNEPHNHGMIITYEADLSSETDIAALSTWLSTFKVAFDIVIHCAGVRGLVPSVPISNQASIATADPLEHMDTSTMLNTFSLRAELCPDDRQEEELGGEEAACSACLHMAATKILVLGSRRGSMVAGGALGGGYAYRASKAAQHAIVRGLAADAPDIIWILCHPGRVHTGLVPVQVEGATGVEEPVADMIRLLEVVKRADSGRFVDRWNRDIPW